MGKAPAADVLVVGAGVFGLAVAFACVGRGLSVLVLEAGDAPGAGASGGLVGALAPHAPDDRPDAARTAQLAALRAAPAFWAEVAAAGGVDPGYARPGRLIPLRTPAARAAAEARAAAAVTVWGGADAWRIVGADGWPGWLDPAAAPEGVVHETLTARIDPRRAVAALAAAVRARGGGVHHNAAVRALGPGWVETAEGRIAAGAVVVAAGAATAGLVPAVPTRGVKGQAARLAAAAPPDAPLISAPGLWIVPHADGGIGVGSTSEAVWDDPASTDGRLDAVLAEAAALCPALRGAPVRDRWAGLRPRAGAPSPVAGAVPGAPGLWVATGGFKTGFALAPAIGAALARGLAGEALDLPAAFAPGVAGTAGLRP